MLVALVPWVPHSDQRLPGLVHGNSDPFLGAVATPGGFLYNVSQGTWGLVSSENLGIWGQKHESAS